MNTAAGSYEQISLGAITRSTTNPRKNFDDASMAELTASVREAGVQSPILLRRLDDPDTGRFLTYEIVCGERRFRAATAAGLETIPAIVRELDDAAAYQAQIIENLQREGLGPMEEAESYAVLARTGISSAEIAAKVAKPAAYVHQRMQLLKLTGKVRTVLAEGVLPLGHALEIAKLAEDEQREALGECVDGGLPSLAEFKRYIQQSFRLELAKAPFSLKDTKLNAAAGACVDCPKRTGADSLLFDDVKAGDQCLDAPCFQAKVSRLIDVKIEELMKSQGSAPLLSESYYLRNPPRTGTLARDSYALVTKAGLCDSVVVGVMVDGPQVGKRFQVCIDKKCAVHHARYSGGAQDPEARKKQAAKDRRDTEVRLRTAQAIVDAVHSSRLRDEDVNIDDALHLADYAFRRMDHAQDGRLATALGWERDCVSDRNSLDRMDMLSGMGLRKAVALAVLATVAGDLTVQHSYGSGEASGLNGLAERHDVDVDAIADRVDAEIKAKTTAKGAKKKPVAKKVVAAAPVVANPVAKSRRPAKRELSAQAKKNIADAMKKRFEARRKRAAKA
jgi:ParB family chromosome partitioning protein